MVTYRARDKKLWVNTNDFWVNMIPTIYDNGTIEFRLHAGTFNANKVIFWILLNIAILEYADKHLNEILAGDKKSLTLTDIVLSYTAQFNDGVELQRKMLDYLAERKAMMKNCYNTGDYMGKADVKLDEGILSVDIVDSEDKSFERLIADSFMLNNKVFKHVSPPKWVRNLNGDASTVIEEIKKE